MIKIFHRTDIPPRLTSEWDRPAWGANPERDLKPVQLAVLGPAKKLLRHATGNFVPKKHTTVANRPIAQPLKLTLNGTERTVKTLDEAKGVAHELNTKIQSLKNQNANYQGLVDTFKNKLSQPNANVDHLPRQIQQYEKLIEEHRQTIAQMEQQLQLLRQTFKF